jgi:DNA topoisomerase-1
MTELIICEKPKSALRIAEALADGKAVKESYSKVVPYYKLKHSGRDIIVGAAVGHLFGLAEAAKNGWSYPVFDIEWKPIFETQKTAGFSKKYHDCLKKLCKDAKEITIACDYDVEGEVIGLNIVKFICRKKDAFRMKFSTLTKDELVEAYEHKSKHLDWGQANAGETRHFLDFYYGVNLSRALTTAIKEAGAFKIMSTGRVQGPALKLIVNREKEIRAFVPKPYWQIELIGEEENKEISAWHEKDKFWDKKDADIVYKKVKGEKKARVKDVKRTRFNQAPPNPFDLTSLQIEAYRCLRISPKETLSIAQELYTSGYISYPRTSSQQLPAKIGYKKIIEAIGRQKSYADLANQLLKGRLTPNNGKKTDPAHPAIYPTGIAPKGAGERGKRLYDLIVRRTLATFGDAATRETMEINLDCKQEIFTAKGTRTVEKGWHVFYGPYLKLKEEELPDVKKGKDIAVKKITLHSKETQPPGRYTPASIIKELEKRNLGTKATRAAIVDTLFQRGYVTGKKIEATELGIKLIETLEKYSPKILDEELTRHFEEEMEEVSEDKKKKDEVLDEAKDILKKILDDFRRNEKKVGEGLVEAKKEAQRIEETIGECPVCGEGVLKIRRGKYGKFIACDRYPECKAIFNVPKNAMIKATDKKCPECSYPVILVIRKGKRPQELCINIECPSKKVKTDKEGKKCPKCKEGKLVLRKSVYGAFLGCDKYPKCRHIEKV